MTSPHKFIQGFLGMKRSFNCPDLSSISSSAAAEVAFRHQPPTKRRRADSTASSSCSALCCCCCEGDIKTSSCSELFFLPPPSSSPATSMEETSRQAVTTSPAAVTPELAPVKMPSSEELWRAPSFPSLRGLKHQESSSSCDYPATAALERFMLPQKGVSVLIDSQGDNDGDDFDHYSLDDDAHSSPWSKLDKNEEEEAFLPSPRKFDSVMSTSPSSQNDGRRRSRIVSFSSRNSSRKSSLSSVFDSASSKAIVDYSSSSLLSLLSSCTLEPTKKQFSKRSIPTVDEADGL